MMSSSTIGNTMTRTIRVLSALLLCLPAAAAAQAPAWSRGLQELTISFDECTRRADAALQAEGYAVDSRGTGYIAATKAIHSAVIMCNDAPGGKAWVNIVVASNDARRDGGVPGTERERLQAQMNRQSTGGTTTTTTATT